MLDLDSLDVEEIATALGDQTDYDRRYLINPDTGEILYWTSDGGIDGQTPVDLDELDLVGIDPLPSHVWYQDMEDFADRVSDEQARRRLARAIQGKGAFRRFKDELHRGYPDLLPVWYAFRDARARRRAVDWLADNELIDADAAARYHAEHPEPDVRETATGDDAHAQALAAVRKAADLTRVELATAKGVGDLLSILAGHLAAVGERPRLVVTVADHDVEIDLTSLSRAHGRDA